MSEFDFGEYAGKIDEVVNGDKENKDKSTAPPTPRKDYKKENTQFKAEIKRYKIKIEELENRESKTVIPTMIKVETLLTKYKEVSNTTKFLWKRINGGSKPDRATIQKLLDFFRYCQDEGEI